MFMQRVTDGYGNCVAREGCPSDPNASIYFDSGTGKMMTMHPCPPRPQPPANFESCYGQSLWYPASGILVENWIYTKMPNPSFPCTIITVPTSTGYYNSEMQSISQPSLQTEHIQKPPIVYYPVPSDGCATVTDFTENYNVPDTENCPPANLSNMMPQSQQFENYYQQQQEQPKENAQPSENYYRQQQQEQKKPHEVVSPAPPRSSNRFNLDPWEYAPAPQLLPSVEEVSLSLGAKRVNPWENHRIKTRTSSYTSSDCETSPEFPCLLQTPFNKGYKPLIPIPTIAEVKDERTQGKNQPSGYSGYTENNVERMRTAFMTMNFENALRPPPPTVLPLPPKPWKKSQRKNRKQGKASGSNDSKVVGANPSKKKKKTGLICKLCKSNRELPKVYRSHILTDEAGKTVCPILRNFVCPICKATGDNAHTIKYCPENKDVSPGPKKYPFPWTCGQEASCVPSRYRTVRNSTGKLHCLKY